jgi:hypothetical protein
VLYDDWSGPPLKPGERYAGSLFSKDCEPFCHKYEQDVWDEFPQPQTRFRIFGVRTPKDSCGVPEPYPPYWETDLEDILALLPSRRSLQNGKVVDRLADVYLEYEILVKVVKKQ